MNFIHRRVISLLCSIITIVALNSCSKKRRVFLDELIVEDYYKINEDSIECKDFKVYKIKLYNIINDTIKDI